MYHVFNGELVYFPTNKVFGREFVRLLKGHEHDANITYDKETDQHVFDSSDYRIFFPTLYSIQKRIDLAKKLSTGIFIWQVEEGLDYFVDLF